MKKLFLLLALFAVPGSAAEVIQPRAGVDLSSLSGDVTCTSGGVVTLTNPHFTSLSGDLTATSGGAVTLANPQRLLTATVNLDATTIVGSTTGTLGDTHGVTLVAGVASKRILVHQMIIQYTRVTASYTGGGNVAAWIDDTTALQFTANVSAAGSFASASSTTIIFDGSGAGVGLTALSGATSIGINKALILRAGSAFTQPGTAAGTAVVTVYYYLVGV